MEFNDEDALPDSLVEVSMALSNANGSRKNSFLDGGECEAYLKTIMDEFSNRNPLQITSAPISAAELGDFVNGEPPQLVKSNVGDVDSGYNEPGASCKSNYNQPSTSVAKSNVVKVRNQKVYRQPCGVISDEDSFPDTDSSISNHEEHIKDTVVPVRKAQLCLDVDANYAPRLPSTLPLNHKLVLLGKITSFISGCVVIESLPNLPALDTGSALYLSGSRPLGEVYDTFGPVKSPYYLVVHENLTPTPDPPKKKSSSKPPRNRRRKKGKAAELDADVIIVEPEQEKVEVNPPVEVAPKVLEAPKPIVPKEKIQIKVDVGEYVYFVADDPSLSIPILCSELAKMRGTDASGRGDVELPKHEQEFSDDEQEQSSRRKQNSKRSSAALDNNKSEATGFSNATTWGRFNNQQPQQTRGGNRGSHHLSGPRYNRTNQDYAPSHQQVNNNNAGWNNNNNISSGTNNTNQGNRYPEYSQWNSPNLNGFRPTSTNQLRPSFLPNNSSYSSQPISQGSSNRSSCGSDPVWVNSMFANPPPMPWQTLQGSQQSHQSSAPWQLNNNNNMRPVQQPMQWQSPNEPFTESTYSPAMSTGQFPSESPQPSRTFTPQPTPSPILVFPNFSAGGTPQVYTLQQQPQQANNATWRQSNSQSGSHPPPTWFPNF